MAIIRSVFIAVYAIIFTIGLPSNIVILAGYSKKKKKIGTDIFIMALAIADLMTSAICLLKIKVWVANNLYCKFKWYLETGLLASQMMMTVVISIDRYLAVCFPVHRRPTVRRAVFIVMFANLLAFLLIVPSIVVTHYDEFIKDCLFRWDINWFTQYDKYILQGYTITCLSTTSLSYCRVINALRRQSKVRALLIKNPASTTAAHNGPGDRSTVLNRDGNEAFALSTDNVSDQRGNSNLLIDEGGVTEDQTGASGIQNGFSNIGVHPKHLQGESKAEGESRTATTVALESPKSVHDETKPMQRQESGNIHDALDMPTATVLTAAPLARTRPAEPNTINTNRQAEKQLTLMLGCVTVIFVVSFIPSFLGRFVPIETRRAFMNRSNLHHTVYAIFFRLYEINSIINLFVYWKLNRRFRKDCQEIFVQVKRIIFN